MIVLTLLVLLLALGPAALYARNVGLFRPPGPAAGRPAVSVLIPARNEAAGIGQAVNAALAATAVDLEVIVLDDASTDETAAIVAALAAADPRVRLARSAPLPPGWCGKQHACWQLAALARHELLLFVDADVVLAPEAPARLATALHRSGADLLSGVPRQIVGSPLEGLLLPLIHFILLAYLPLAAMRRSRHPAYAAGCGQLFVTTRRAYQQAGGHAAIRATLHDGLRLPAAYRTAGLPTDLCDVTALASCRMYHGAAATWRGLGKNAVEGLGAPRRIVPLTLLLGLGQVAPLPVLWLALANAAPLPAVGAGLAWLLSLAPRLDAARRFGQPWVSALLHPVGLALLLLLQWQALLRHWRGRPATWKGRGYAAT